MALKRLEPCAGKLACTVLRGANCSNAVCLLGDRNKLDLVVNSYQSQTGGQKKKLAIANAIYNKNKLLIADEILNAVDQESKLIAYKLFDKYLPLSTKIFVQHQIATHLVEKKDLIERENGTAILAKKIVDLSAKDNMEENELELNEFESFGFSGEQVAYIFKLKQLLKIKDEKLEQIKENAYNILNNNATNPSEEIEFFHSIITMSKLTKDNGEVHTSFQIIALNGNESFVKFYPSETKDIDILGSVCSLDDIYTYQCDPM